MKKPQFAKNQVKQSISQEAKDTDTMKADMAGKSPDKSMDTKGVLRALMGMNK